MVKAEIKEETLDDEVNEADLESDSADNEEEECFRIIEETVVDVSTLPGRTVLLFVIGAVSTGSDRGS